MDGVVFRRSRGKFKPKMDRWEGVELVTFRPNIKLTPEQVQMLREYIETTFYEALDYDESCYCGSDDHVRDHIARLALEPVWKEVKRLQAMTPEARKAEATAARKLKADMDYYSQFGYDEEGEEEGDA